MMQIRVKYPHEDGCWEDPNYGTKGWGPWQDFVADESGVQLDVVHVITSIQVRKKPRAKGWQGE